MNNKEFIAALSAEMGYPASTTQRLVSTILDGMGDAFQEGEGVRVENLGTFETRKKLERIIFNPSTQQRMLVPPKIVLGFRPNAELKEALKKKMEEKDIKKTTDNNIVKQASNDDKNIEDKSKGVNIIIKKVTANKKKGNKK